MTMIYVRPFGPVGNTTSIAVTAGTANVAVTRPGIGTQSLRVTISGSDPVYLSFGTSAVTATTSTGMPMLANSVETFLLPNDITHVAAISTGTGSRMFVTTGESA